MFQYTSLVSIDLPTGITEIGMSAFANCTGLKSFVIPDSVTTLGNGVFFWHCSNLETVKLSLNITELPRYAFADTGLHHFVVPERITAIGGICFREVQQSRHSGSARDEFHQLGYTVLGSAVNHKRSCLRPATPACRPQR